MKQLVFSATGRTQNVVDILCKDRKIDEFVPLCSTNLGYHKMRPDDLCIIASSVYEGRIPQVAVDNILKVDGNGAKAVIMVVYGNRNYDNALAELKDVCQKRGFVTVAAITAVAQHSIATSVAADRPDETDIEDLKNYSKQIMERYENNTLPTDVSVPGTVPTDKTGRLPFHPKANKSCVNCHLCSTNCPVGAIPYDNSSLTDNTKCISCLRCMEICPAHSRTMLPPLRKVVDIVLGRLWKKPRPYEFYMD